MKAEDLRIGNLLYYGDGELVVDINVLRDIDLYTQLGTIPIELTKEWLLKFRFSEHRSEEGEYYSKSWGRNGMSIIIWDTNYSKFKYELGKGMTKILESVHKLQNFHYEFTGEELTLK